MSSPQILIAKTTDAVAGRQPFEGMRIDQGMVPCTIQQEGLSGSEVIPVLMSIDGGKTFVAVSQEGAAVELSVTNTAISINSPMRIAVTKPATSSATGVFLSARAQS